MLEIHDDCSNLRILELHSLFELRYVGCFVHAHHEHPGKGDRGSGNDRMGLSSMLGCGECGG